MRFAVHQESDLPSISCHLPLHSSSHLAKSYESHKSSKAPTAIAKTQFPKSVSISEILQAGKLVKAKPKKKATLLLEKFDVKTGEWHEGEALELLVDAEKSTIAISEFTKKHICNDYCEMLELPPVVHKFD